MQLLITRQTVALKRNVRPGELVDVEPSEARVLMAARKARPATVAPKAPEKSKSRKAKS